MPQINLMELAEQSFGTSLEQLDDRRIYKLLVKLVQERSAACPLNNGKKKLYYNSAEFLIGKLLINNMIDLGIYDEVKDQLTAAGHDLNKIEEFEVEPSLGNGGLGRLAACFLDSIATLGLTGDGVGLNYHYGLFRQRFVDNQQKAVPDEWLGEQDILVDDDHSYTVEFGDFAVTSKLVNIDVPGYGQSTKNRLRLFDLASVDAGLVPGSSIDFDKTEIAKNLTLFLYPDDSDAQGRLLRIYQEYFMVSNAAQLLIDEAVERGSNLHDLADYAVVQINDTHPTMVIPELIRLLTTEHGIEFDEAVTIVRSMVAYTNHTILAEALEKWPLASLQKVSPAIADIIVKLDEIAKAEHDDPRVDIIDKHDTVHMAHMDIHFTHSTNGVAALHTEILKNSELHGFYELYPEKFNNKTNGITFRRWLLSCNEELSEEIENKIATFTGGRAAEEVKFGEVTTGASNDIEQATKIARAMISRYGMSDDFDMVAMENVSNQYLGGDASLTCSFETQTLLDKKVVELVRMEHQKALKILQDNIGKLHELAKYLYEHETITGEEFMKILNAPVQAPTVVAESESNTKSENNAESENSTEADADTSSGKVNLQK